MSMSPFEFRNAPEFFYSAAKSHHNIVWSEKATLYGRLVLAASGSEMQTATPIQCSLFTLSGDVMATSKLQEETRNRLRILFKGYDFSENYRPDWMRNPETGYPLEFDFWLSDAKIAIEVQGRQHYEYIPHFHGTIDNFNKQVQRDQFKRDFCQSANIHFYEISTKEDIDLFIEKAKAHSKPLSYALHKKNTALKSLEYYAAELGRESSKPEPHPKKLDALIKKMAHIAEEYQVSIKDVRADFTITKMQMAFFGKPIVDLKILVGEEKKQIKIRAVVMSYSSTEVCLRWYTKQGDDQHHDRFDLATGLQLDENSHKWAIKPDHLQRVKDAIQGVQV